MSVRTRTDEGAALIEYIGAVVAVGVLMLALVAVREHRPERRPPIDPVAHLVAPLPPSAVRRPRPAARVRPARPGRVRPRRPPRPRPTVMAPTWAVGW
ncbi:MAG: hypothetical protein ACLGG9_00620 [Thermoleophilia bacterium]